MRLNDVEVERTMAVERERVLSTRVNEMVGSPIYLSSSFQFFFDLTTFKECITDLYVLYLDYTYCHARDPT